MTKRSHGQKPVGVLFSVQWNERRKKKRICPDVILLPTIRTTAKKYGNKRTATFDRLIIHLLIWWNRKPCLSPTKKRITGMASWLLFLGSGERTSEPNNKAKPTKTSTSKSPKVIFWNRSSYITRRIIFCKVYSMAWGWSKSVPWSHMAYVVFRLERSCVLSEAVACVACTRGDENYFTTCYCDKGSRFFACLPPCKLVTVHISYVSQCMWLCFDFR